jgi:hypothetical protein
MPARNWRALDSERQIGNGRPRPVFDQLREAYMELLESGTASTPVADEKPALELSTEPRS